MEGSEHPGRTSSASFDQRPAPTSEPNTMRGWGRGSLRNFLGNCLIYRNVSPCDPRLPGLSEVRQRLGIADVRIPRKNEDGYAVVVAELLRIARSFDAPSAPIRYLLYLGDTRLSDGTAFANLCRVTGWSGMAFIGAERQGPPSLEQNQGGPAAIYTGGRWDAVFAFAELAAKVGMGVDEHTAVVIDIDKTAIGARGRNDRVIDRARVDAVRTTVSDLLGDSFCAPEFLAAYERLNTAEFHPFTADNQDYLAYICLVLGSGLVTLDDLVSDIQGGSLQSFDQFIHAVDARSALMSAALAGIHHQILDLVKEGDPTPFKAFRRNEYLATVHHMSASDDAMDTALLLRDKIVITHEVRQVAELWQGRGALLFGLSDKPDEAALPTPDLAARGYQPLHHVEAHMVGLTP